MARTFHLFCVGYDYYFVEICYLIKKIFYRFKKILLNIKNYLLYFRWHNLLRKKGTNHKQDFYLQEWQLKTELSYKIKEYSTTLYTVSRTEINKKCSQNFLYFFYKISFRFYLTSCIGYHILLKKI